MQTFRNVSFVSHKFARGDNLLMCCVFLKLEVQRVTCNINNKYRFGLSLSNIVTYKNASFEVCPNTCYIYIEYSNRGLFGWVPQRLEKTKALPYYLTSTKGLLYRIFIDIYNRIYKRAWIFRLKWHSLTAFNCHSIFLKMKK